MTASAEGRTPRLLRQAWDDLQPFPGRFGTAWRIALLCAFVAATAMLYKIPEAAISCYLVIFLTKPDSVQNCIMAVGLIGLASIVVALMIPVINFSVDSPAMRLAVMFFASYVFLFLASATPLGEQAAIVGLIIAFLMTLVTMVPVGQIGDQGLLAAWKMACMPMFLMILFNLVLGVPAHRHVIRLIAERLRRSADALETAGASAPLEELLAEGNGPSLQQTAMVKLLHLVPKARSAWLNGAVETSGRIMLAALAPRDRIPQERRAELAAALRRAADAAEAGRVPDAPDMREAEGAERELRDALADLSRSDGGGAPRPPIPPLLAPDAFTNPDHQRYALKTSIAAVLCYLIYTGLGWDGIHTAMITCYVAALGTTGETVRKLTLRIVGCLCGAAMGVAALLWIMPNLTTVGGLMALVFCGVLPAAWVSSGSERISYAGVQIALAFLLTTLNGFGPSFEFSQAGDRIAGILLGIFVIFVVFTQFWPKSVAGEVRGRLASIVDELAGLARRPLADRLRETDVAFDVLGGLERIEERLDTAAFEPRRQRASDAELARWREIAAELRPLFVDIRFSRDTPETALRRLDALAVELAARTEASAPLGSTAEAAG